MQGLVDSGGGVGGGVGGVGGGGGAWHVSSHSPLLLMFPPGEGKQTAFTWSQEKRTGGGGGAGFGRFGQAGGPWAPGWAGSSGWH